MNKSRGRGRRAGSPGTREQILAAARKRFLAEGYHTTTMRAVASDAGVDVALVSYYFGSKQGVFGAAMALAANPVEIVAAVIEGDLETMAVRLLQSLLAVWDDPVTGPPLQQLARTVAVEADLARAVREAVGREIVDRLAGRIGGPQARQRAGVFSAQMAGVIFSRYILQIEPVASMSADELVQALSPSLALTIAPVPVRTGLRVRSAAGRQRSRG